MTANPTSVGIGIIGLGRLGQVRARALANRVGGARLVAVTDIDGGLAETTAARLGCDAVSSAAELVARDDIDGVVVATPTWIQIFRFSGKNASPTRMANANPERKSSGAKRIQTM